MYTKKITRSFVLLVVAFSTASANASWSAKRTKDPMGGPSSIDICTISTNSVVQDFPYNRGKTTARLCISKTGDAYETYITLNQGQLMCHAGSEKFMLRADENEARTMRCTPTTDGSNEQAYFYEGFDSVKEILSARKSIRIKVTLYSHGSVVFEFKPVGRALPADFASPLM